MPTSPGRTPMEHRLRLSASRSDSRLRPPGSPSSARSARASGSSGSDTEAGSDDERLQVQVGSGSQLARRSVSRLGHDDAPAMPPLSQPQPPGQRAATVAATTAATPAAATAAPPQPLLQRHTRPLSFPEDHGPHPDFRTEWWYYTGHLETESGKRYGYQVTFFRFGVRDRILAHVQDARAAGVLAGLSVALGWWGSTVSSLGAGTGPYTTVFWATCSICA